MICLHRPRGDEVWINPDLMVVVEPDVHGSSITLADGKQMAVAEAVEHVAAAVMQFRSSVLAAAESLSTMLAAAERSVVCQRGGR